ncbi:MAG: MBOAT family protein [Flavobacteriales bacterium]|nr:MBOAT family protein [Flavobacteriales bacterium]
MIFNSLDFAVFLPLAFILYWALNKHLRLQNLAIVGSSYFFYGWWDWRFLSLIIFSTLVDYSVGLAIANQQASSHKRKMLLWTSIIVNLGLLGFFKYYNFFLDNFVAAFSFFGSSIDVGSLNIILPVGISFYTFQTLSYTIDVYNGKLKPTKDFIAFCAFVSFFPQLVAGPIERASHLLPQFYRKRTVDYTDMVEGFHRILWGLFKKIVIADRLAIVVNEIYNYPTEYHGLTLVMGTVFFAFQIYCDFSGYSEIAIGTARLFGFDLMTNFRTPYFSQSLTEFWRRWHISLSTWFRDYLYIPLGGNKTTVYRWYINIMIVFIVSGFWHGASWTFIIWGAIHGVVLILESRINLPTKVFFGWRLLQGLGVFIIVCLGWVFFRANTIGDALYILSDMLSFGHYQLAQLSPYVVPAVKGTVFPIDIVLASFFILVLLIAEYLFTVRFNFQGIRYSYRLPIYVVGIWVIFVLGAFEKNEFIYFQF